jgi:hypothetical protein
LAAAVGGVGVGTICCGAAVAARAGGRGGCGGCSPRRGGGVGPVVAVVAFGSGAVAGSAVMMLTGGIEAAEGKSNFDGTAAEGGLEAVV